MAKHFAILAIAMTLLVSTALTVATQTGLPEEKSQFILVAQQSPGSPEAVACQKEEAELSARAAQCTTDECRESLRAAIESHNRRCR